MSQLQCRIIACNFYFLSLSFSLFIISVCWLITEHTFLFDRWYDRWCICYNFITERERRICCRSSVRLSVVCNVLAPYSASWHFPQCFYAIWYLGHPLIFTENFTEIVPNARGLAKYSDFGPIEGYISETVQNGR